MDEACVKRNLIIGEGPISTNVCHNGLCIVDTNLSQLKWMFAGQFSIVTYILCMCCMKVISRISDYF